MRKAQALLRGLIRSGRRRGAVSDDDRGPEGAALLLLLLPRHMHRLRLHHHQSLHLQQSLQRYLARSAAIATRNPKKREREREGEGEEGDLVEHAEEGGGGAVGDGAVAAAEAHGLQGAAVEAPRPREAPHQRYVQPRTPRDRRPRPERVERAPAHPQTLKP